MTNSTTSPLTAEDAAARILAAAAELGTSRQEAILFTKAVNAVRTNRPTDVPLNDTPQHQRRRLAHVVRTLLYDPALNPDDVVAAVTGNSLPASAQPPENRVVTMDTPYTRWYGDSLHGRSKVLTAVWVRLDAIYVRIKGAPEHAIDDGLDFTGEVPGLLHGWWPTHRGHWLGVVDYDIAFADGRRRTIRAVDQLVPLYALRPRGEPDETGGDPDTSKFA